MVKNKRKVQQLVYIFKLKGVKAKFTINEIKKII